MRTIIAVGFLSVALVACGGTVSTNTVPPPTVTPTRAAPVAVTVVPATIAIGSVPYTKERWKLHPIPGNARIVESQPGRITVAVRGSQSGVADLYTTVWSGDGYLIVSSEQKGELRVVTAHKQTTTLIAVFSAPTSAGEVLIAIDDSQ